MKNLVIKLALLLALTMSVLPMFSARAQETFLWGADVSSTGEPVTSPVLEAGIQYRITAKGVFGSDYFDGGWEYLVDAQYYAVNPPHTHWWTDYYPAPDGHSFLQIDGMDAYWGPFNNGGIDDFYGHEYTIYYTGTGAPIVFTIVDWVDMDYSDNQCHFSIEIWEFPPTEEGKSPGYWGHQFKAYYEDKGQPHHSWEELVAWTQDIDGYYGIDPPDFNGYELPPVSSLDTDSNGVFTTYDAYIIFTNKRQWKDVWIGLANWYNWAAGFPPYY